MFIKGRRQGKENLHERVCALLALNSLRCRWLSPLADVLDQGS